MLGGVLGINPAVVSTERKFDLLAEGKDKTGYYVYGQAQGAIAQYDAVKIDNDGQLIPLTTTVSGAEPTAVGIAQVAFADNQYGWVFVKGGGSGSGVKVNVLASAVAGAKLYTTATAGALDDTATDLVQGLTILSTDGGSGSAIECYSPVVMTTNCQD